MSRLKGRGIRFLQPLHALLPARLAGGVPIWAPATVSTVTGTERDVEIPWVASAVTTCLGLWLDVGYAHAEARYWEALATGSWRRHLRYGYGLDVAPPGGQDPLPAHILGDVVHYDFGALPRFDLITCVSTLEHLGCDNTRYASGVSRDAEPLKRQEEALRRLLLALTPRGRLLVTLPYGVFEDHGWFLQYDATALARLSAVAKEAGRGVLGLHYYRLGPARWERTTPDEAADCRYRDAEWRASAVALVEFA